MTDSNLSNSDRVGQFVTNKYLVTVLLMLVMSMGAYIFNQRDRGGEAYASEITRVKDRVSVLEIEMASRGGRTDAQFAEIMRRMDAWERYIYGNARPSR